MKIKEAIKKSKKEICLDNLLTDSNWAQVFADESAGNVFKTIREAPPGSDVDLTEVSRTDVKTIIAAVNGENDGDEWLGVFHLKDGRYLIASGGCDYTGWDCQASNNLTVCKTFKDVMTFGLSESEKERLGLI